MNLSDLLTAAEEGPLLSASPKYPAKSRYAYR